jgi:positive regulator of sigma E activity
MLPLMRSAVPVIIAGIVIWTIALIIAIIVNAVAKIILTCVLGILLGFIGIRYTKRRAKREQG